MMAFMPGPLFHLSIEALLLRLYLAGQTKGAEHLRSSGSPCALYLIDGVERDPAALEDVVHEAFADPVATHTDVASE